MTIQSFRESEIQRPFPAASDVAGRLRRLMSFEIQSLNNLGVTSLNWLAAKEVPRSLGESDRRRLQLVHIYCRMYPLYNTG